MHGSVFGMERFPRVSVLVLGDVMLDEALLGRVERISPEAPVPVFERMAVREVPGGAGNVAANVAALGSKVVVCGIVGVDEAGARLRRALEQRGVDTRGLIEDGTRPTTTKTRLFADDHQLLRIDLESRAPLGAELERRAWAVLDREIESADVVLVSDYGKGAVTEGLIKLVLDKCRALGKRSVVDPAGVCLGKYRGAEVIKLNARQAATFAGTEPGEDREMLAAGRIFEATGVAAVVITRGREGACVYHEGQVRRIAAAAREVFDVTGAGDTFLAAFGVMLAGGADYQTAAVVANAAAGLAVEKVGTAVVTDVELMNRTRQSLVPLWKLATLEEARPAWARLRTHGKKLVFTIASFARLGLTDLELLHRARALGDVHVVGLVEDRAGGSLLGAEERGLAVLLASLACVDQVVILKAHQAREVMTMFGPDVVVREVDGFGYSDQDQRRERGLRVLRGEESGVSQAEDGT